MAEYLIYKENMEGFEKKIASIRRKCEKHNIPFTYEKKEEVIKFISVNGSAKKVPATFVKVEVKGLLKLGNYDVVAKIDHFSAGNIVYNFDESTPIDSYWFKADCNCRHCNKKIRRSTTYLLKDKDDPIRGLIQIGSSCLKDFTGVDAESVAAYESVAHVAEEFSDPFKFDRYTGEYYLDQILSYAIDSIKEFGYRPTSQNDSTKSDVLKRLKSDDRTNNYPLAHEIIEWMKGYHDDSDYSIILNSIANMPLVSIRMFGYIVSAVNIYYKYQEKIKRDAIRAQQHEEEKAASGYVGEVGKRINIDVDSCHLVSSGDGVYGYWYLYKFIDMMGNILTWFTSSPCIDEDKKVSKIIATIKNHEEYEGVKQTQLSRVKVIA